MDLALFVNWLEITENKIQKENEKTLKLICIDETISDEIIIINFGDLVFRNLI